jgi:hypothetical protein
MLFERVARFILEDTGIVVSRAAALPTNDPPFLGCVDGLEVRILATVEDADAAWLALHLAGHALQWAADPAESAKALAFERGKTPIDELRASEQQAGDFVLWLCQRALGRRAEIWFVARSQRDWEKFAAWVGTGEAGKLELRARPPSAGGQMATFPLAGAYEV